MLQIYQLEALGMDIEPVTLTPSTRMCSDSPATVVVARTLNV
jgi:hypothetical protein